MRPQTLAEYIGQRHLLGEGKPLRKALLAGHCHSMILWGPPGTGKTTLAELMAHYCQAQVERLSAVTAGVKEIRAAIDKAKENQWRGVRTLLFVDEVHRFNKSQQDTFLPYIEDGTVIFIGATTENPSFELNNALLSRARVYLLKRLTDSEVEQLLQQALCAPHGLGEAQLQFAPDCLSALARVVDGDGRKALNFLELLADMAEADGTGQKCIDQAQLAAVVGEPVARFDKQGDLFYDLISALHKSVRGSAPDAALYWYARIVAAGGDPLYVARRLLAIASEDVGNADPRAMQVALAAWDCFERVGAAEGERAIAQAIVYLASAPKSNAVYTAWNAALTDAKTLPAFEVPVHLRNAPTRLMQELGYGAAYRYAHDEPGAYAAGEVYLPAALAEKRYYQPTARGFEQKIGQKLDYLAQLDQAARERGE
ncbi:MAG: replication-associated recombination protein A [Aeromonas sp.]